MTGAVKLTDAQARMLARIKPHVDWTTLKGSGDYRVARALQAAGLGHLRNEMFFYINDAGRLALLQHRENAHG